MTDYFASQTGAGLTDGTSPDNAWPVASIVWATVGGGGNTLYMLDTITTTMPTTAGANGVLGNPTVIRGDYPGRVGTMAPSSGSGITSNGRVYIDVRNLNFSSITASLTYGVSISGGSTQFNIYCCNFEDCWGSIYCVNDGNDFYLNTIIRPTLDATGFGIRLSNGASNNDVYLNTISGSIGPSVCTGVLLDVAGTINNKIRRNHILNWFGNGLNIFSCDSNYVYCNIFGPDVAETFEIADADSNYICNNTINHTGFRATTYSTITLTDNGGAGAGSNLNIIVNNIITANKTLTTRIATYGTSTQTMGSGNIINSNLYYFLNNLDPATAGAFHFNDGVTNDAPSFNTLQSRGYEASGIFGEDPKLSSDNKLSVDSPAVTVGINWWAALGWPNPEGFDGEPLSSFDTDLGANGTTFGPFHTKNL